MALLSDFQSVGGALHWDSTQFSLHIQWNCENFSWRLEFLFYLDNILEIYYDNFFEVTYEIEKNI